VQSLRTLALTAALLTGVAGAQATLVNRGGGMIYDTTLNLTWLADMNYAKTSGYVAGGLVYQGGASGSNDIYTDGTMGWDAASKWANNLVYGGFDDWRLPTLNSGDISCDQSIDPGRGLPRQYYGYRCTGGELSHLFVADLGNKPVESVWTQTGDTAEQIANLALFSNVQDGYWSGLEYAPDPREAWLFLPRDGAQSLSAKESYLFAVAVRPGDVAATVPEPQTLALVTLAFGAAMLARTRRPL
jgi:hypothetical protein